MARIAFAPHYDAQLWAAYPRAHRTGCQPKEAVAVVHRLSRWARLRRPKIIFIDGDPMKASHSFYRGKTRTIHYDTSMLSWLTVAHEFSHYWHHVLIQEELMETIGRFLIPKPKKNRWHGRVHRQLVADSIQYIDKWVDLHGQDLPFGRKK